MYKYPAKVSRVSVNTGRWGTIPVYLVDSGNTPALADVIFFIHGAGWVFGSYHTHEKLVRELAARTGSLLIFPEYSRSPEARYPVAIEQCYSVMCMVPELVRSMGFTANMKLYKQDPSAWPGSVADVSTFLRIALTGKTNSPDLYTVMQLLGPDRSKARIQAAIDRL